MPRHQLINSFKKGLFQCRILKGQILLQRQPVHFSFITRKRQDALDLRRKYKMPVDLRIIHRLNPKEVPCQHQSLLLLIPHSKPEHSPQLVQGLFPILLNGIHQHFRIRMGAKRNARRL